MVSGNMIPVKAENWIEINSRTGRPGSTNLRAIIRRTAGPREIHLREWDSRGWPILCKERGNWVRSSQHIYEYQTRFAGKNILPANSICKGHSFNPKT